MVTHQIFGSIVESSNIPHYWSEVFINLKVRLNPFGQLMNKTTATKPASKYYANTFY